MDNETRISVSFKNSVTNANKLDNYAKQLKQIYGILSAIDKGKLAQMGDFNVSLTKVNDNANKIEKTTSKFSKNLNTAFNLGKIAIVSRKVYNLAKGFGELTNKSASYIENLNLLEVAYANIDKKSGQFNEDIKVTSARIEKLIDNMAEVYGLDESDLTRSFGIFRQLANAMELPNKEAERLSELMVKMRQDIASLYNLDLSRAGNALQSALAGQVRPIRSATGADITEKTLQKTVDTLGLDTTINKLSYVEKRLIMVISLTNQLKKSQGDYGRTIESVANQVKVFHDQWDRLSRAVGNVFYPLMKSVLPVVNGVLMALTEIANIIASLVGFKLEDFDYSGLAGVSDATLDLEESMNDAGDSVDKLKKKLSGLRSFDKLNVISTPKDASSGVSSGTINPKILEAFNSAFGNYDDMLGKVKMKANDIRDSIMEWLGFTKKINPLTGEVSWKYDGIKKTLKNVWESFKKLNPLVKIFTGFAVWKVFKQMWTWGGKLLNVIGVGGLAKSISNVMKDMGNIKNDLPTISSNMDRFKTAVAGVALAFLGQQGLVSAMDSINEKGPTVANVLGGIGSAISMIAGFTMIGSAFGPVGAGIGLITGVIVSLVTAITNYKDAGDLMIEQSKKELEVSQKVLQSYKDRKQAIEDNMNQSLAVSTYHQQLVGELGTIVDENGKIKKGYEDRATFILNELNTAYGTEFKLLDLQFGKYEDIKNKVYELIEAEKARIILNANKEVYDEALKKQAQAYHDLKVEQDKQNETNTLANEILGKQAELHNLAGTSAYRQYEYYSKLTGETYKGAYAQIQMEKDLKKTDEMLKNQNASIKNLRDVYNSYNEDIYFYENLSTAILTENKEEQERIIYEYTNKVKDGNESVTSSYDELFAKLEYDRNLDIENHKKYNKEWTEADEEKWKKTKEDLLKHLEDETTTVKELTPNIVSAWGNLSMTSKDEFLKHFNNLPADIQQNVLDKMYDLGYDISDELQKGINSINPKIKFGMDTSAIKTTLQKLKKTNPEINTWFKMAGTSIDAVISKLAVGGMPPVGQLFIANEKGPELVGNIGGKSFVANQSQMMELLDKKIGNAQKSTGTQVINLYLDADHKIGSYTMEQLQNMAKTDGKPITIGG